MNTPARGHLIYRDRKILLKYHRLLSGAHPHPPNSLSALRRVLNDGAEVVEFDIGLTQDDRFVLLHDASLDRETGGRGPLRGVTEAQFKALRLRDGEPTATLAEVAALLHTVDRPVKVHVDLKEATPISPDIGRLLLAALAPIRGNRHLSVVVGCMGDWNLRLLRRLDPDLEVGLDFGYYLDAPVDAPVRLPTRVNAYGYLDDHPLGFRRVMPVQAYLEDRLEILLGLLPAAREVYVRKEFLLQALADGVNPIAVIQAHRPGVLVDVWTFYADEPDLQHTLRSALDAGANQLSSPAPVRILEMFEAPPS